MSTPSRDLARARAPRALASARRPPLARVAGAPAEFQVAIPPLETPLPGDCQRVEDIPFDNFLPPCCPEAECPTHRAHAPVPFDWVREKPHFRRSPPFRVPRFRCKSCGRSFSQMTFAASYWLKRPELLEPIAAGLVASSSHRALGRSLGCAGSTVTRQAARLGRHAILLQALLLQHRPPEARAESIVFDDFETFAASQFFPLAIGTAVSEQSGLVVDLDFASHARGGRLNPWERAERNRLYARFGRPPRRQRNAAFRRLLDRLLAQLPPGRQLHLVTDEHTVYRLATEAHPLRERIRHERHPNPPRGPRRAPRSAAARRRDRALFEADQLHRLIRHSTAPHRRETIAFARRVAFEVGRAFLAAVWRNLVKARSERRPRRGTSAMQAGITTKPWRWRDVLRQRLFPALVPLPDSWRAIYRQEVHTPGADPQLPFAPRFIG